jgi:hypothetical protein
MISLAVFRFIYFLLQIPVYLFAYSVVRMLRVFGDLLNESEFPVLNFQEIARRRIKQKPSVPLRLKEIVVP